MTPSLNTCLPILGGKSFILGVSVPALLGIVKQLFSTPVWVCLSLVVVSVSFLFLDVILYPRSSMVLIVAVICLKLSWINGFLQLILGLMMNRYFICIGERGFIMAADIGQGLLHLDLIKESGEFTKNLLSCNTVYAVRVVLELDSFTSSSFWRWKWHNVNCTMSRQIARSLDIYSKKGTFMLKWLTLIWILMVQSYFGTNSVWLHCIVKDW